MVSSQSTKKKAGSVGVVNINSRDVPDVKFVGFRIPDVARYCLLDSGYRIQNSEKLKD